MKAKILYVDDEQINLKLFEINYSKKYEVFVAVNGYRGLEILDKEPEILVVISDMKMPEMNGIEFIKKAKEKHPDKNYFILTGYDITLEIQNAQQNGLISKCFSKPFNVREIEKNINNAIMQA